MTDTDGVQDYDAWERDRREAREEIEAAKRYNPKFWEEDEERLIAKIDQALRFKRWRYILKSYGG
ncbi:MAG: hypothetical protein ACRDHG_04645 [Anaerolineales bacterium]